MKDMGELQKAVGNDRLLDAVRNNEKIIRIEGSNNGAGSKNNGRGKDQGIELPPIIDIMDFLDKPLSKPPELIKGMFHKGTKLILSGASKSRKTWAMAHLGVCVATGQPWWGFDTVKGKVLYANFEIPPAFFQERIQSIKEKLFLEANQIKGQFHLWNLRGHAADISQLADKVIEQAKEKYDLIILDPIYRVLGDRDENSNGQMAGLMNEIDRIVEATGAGVAFAHHYSKGNQAKKNAMDRMSGAGVFARDADSLLSMTEHQSPDTYTVNAILRNHKPVEPFCVALDHPIMERWDGADPAKLKNANGSESKYVMADLLKTLNVQHLTSTELEKQYIAAIKASTGTFDKLFKEAKENQLVEKCEDGKRWKAVSPIYPPGWKSENAQLNENGTMVQT